MKTYQNYTGRAPRPFTHTAHTAPSDSSDSSDSSPAPAPRRAPVNSVPPFAVTAISPTAAVALQPTLPGLVASLLPQGGKGERKPKPQAADAPYPAPPFGVPDTSPRVLWRLTRLFRDIVFCTQLPQNDRGGCYAGNGWFARKYKCDPATVRRYLAELKKYGWVQVIVRGPDRLIVPLVSVRVVLSFLPQFARLLRGVLRGFIPPVVIGTRVPLTPDREESSNSSEGPAERKRRAAQAARALSAADQAVVVQAANAGVSEDVAEALVRKLGRESVQDALDVTRLRLKKGTIIPEPGGYIRRMAEKLAAGVWKLPAKLIDDRAKAERKAERDKAAADRVVQAPSPPTATATMPTAATPPPTSAPSRSPVPTMPTVPMSPQEAARQRYETLPAEQQKALAQQALAAVQKQIDNGTSVLNRPDRENVKRQGVKARVVLQAAYALAETFGQTVADTRERVEE